MPSVKVCLFVFCFFVVVVVVFWVFLAPLATMISACAIDGAIQRKMCDKGLLRAGKKGKNALVISNEDVDDIIRIIKSLQNLGIIMNGVSETVKHETTQTKRCVSWYISNFRCFNVRKYVDWKRCNQSWKRCTQSKKMI